VAVAAVVVAGTAVAIAAPWHAGADGGASPASAEPSAQTSAVTRADMSTSQSFDGTLGFGTPQAVRGAKNGTVTWLATAGSTVTRNQPLYKVDEVPVPLFYGAVPMYRSLSVRNSVGHDVKVVADNLKALGYAIGTQPSPGSSVTITTPAPSAGGGGNAGAASAGKTPASPAAPPAASTETRVKVRAGDGVLTAELISAIKKWQSALGMPSTGAVGPGDVLVLPGPVRVDAATSQVGDPASGPLLKVTPTTKAVLVQVDAGQAGTMHLGDAVTVHLPDSTTAAATVTSVGTAASQQEGQNASGPQKITVIVTLADPSKVKKYDSATVQAEFAGEKHPGVLTVPLTALLALREGGYGVQLASGQIVAVKTGLFSKGTVEVSGEGLSEGTRVVTAS
jgi:hypothetical protein